MRSDFVILDIFWDIFCELLSKNHKKRYKIKKLMYKAIRKYPIKIPRKALGSRLLFLIVLRRWEWIIWLSEYFTSFILFLFRSEPAKKMLCLTYAYSWTFPLPHTRQYALSWTTSSPLRAYVLYGWPLHISGFFLDILWI